MVRARKVCTRPGCPNLQPCLVEGHTRRAWEGSTRRTRLPGDWDKRRRYVLDRDPICKRCDRALSAEVDHIVPGDDHSYTNLQGLCARCHRTKTQQEAAAARTPRG